MFASSRPNFLYTKKKWEKYKKLIVILVLMNDCYAFFLINLGIMREG